MTKNYFYVNERKIPMSQETADNIEKANEKNLNVITKFPNEDRIHFYINKKEAGCLFPTEEQGDDYNGCEISGHLASLYLNNINYGMWYDEDGNEIGGYLFFKPNEK